MTPKNNTERVALQVTKGDIIIALRVLVIASLAIFLFVTGHSQTAWFMIAVQFVVEVVQALRYIAIVIRETPAVYNITNAGPHTHPGL